MFTYAKRQSERFSLRSTFNRLHALSFVPCKDSKVHLIVSLTISVHYNLLI